MNRCVGMLIILIVFTLVVLVFKGELFKYFARLKYTEKCTFMT
jgi:hypothetical protein